MKPATLIAAAMLFQTIAGQSPNPPSGGAIEGIVVRIGTGEPIAEAQVLAQATTLRRPAANAGAPRFPFLPQTVTTDAQGRFLIKDLGPGPYRLFFSANGYVRQELGQRGLPGSSGGLGSGTPVDVAAGQTVRGIRVALTPAGNVSGRIGDLDGRPIAGVPVQILKPVYNFRGERTMQSAGAASTDDRGEYRVYWVTPGHYYVLAGSAISPRRGGLIGTASPNEVPGYSVLPTYYPNAPELSAATPVDIQSGGQLNAIDFFLERLEARRIRGRVVDAATGRWPAAANIRLATHSAIGGTNSRTSAQSYNAADGTFELTDVPPGLHEVIVEVVSRGTPAPPAVPPIVPAGAGRTGVIFTDVRPRDLVTAGAQVAVHVDRSEVENLVITTGSAISVSGHLTVEGISTTSGADPLRVQLTPSSTGAFISSVQGPPAVALAPDGMFTFENVLPGEYRVQVAGLQSDFYIKEVRFGGQDALNQPLHLSPSAQGILDVVVSTHVSRIRGTITDETSQPVPNVQAVLVPDQYRDRPDLFRNVTTDSDGRFLMEGVAPGNYKVFAWAAMEQFAYYDPDFLKRHEQSGQPVKVSESSSQTVQVRLIPAGR